MAYGHVLEDARVDPQMMGHPVGREPEPLTPDQIKGIVAHEIEDSLGGIGSKIQQEQQMGLRYYLGRPLGNERKDKSRVVMNDVQETVDWAMAGLLPVFLGGQYVWRYKPNREDQTENAKLATAYINHLFLNQLKGETVLYDWMKTALLEKTGIVKAYWETRHEPRTETFRGQDGPTIVNLIADLGSEPIAATEVESLPNPQDPEGPPIPRWDVTFRYVKDSSGMGIDGVPPEEFLIARRAIELDDNTSFTAQKKKYRVSDLVTMGFDFDEVVNLPADDGVEFSSGRLERHDYDDAARASMPERADPASREIWMTDCYLHIDADGDGYSELRHILVAGSHGQHILENIEISHNPFVSICPVRMPHKFHGLSLADLVMDLQKIRSTIARQILDYTYLAGNPRNAILEGMVNIKDMLTSSTGGLVRVKSQEAIMPILTPPLPRETFQTLEYLEKVRNDRTGVQAQGAELDASAINATATGMGIAVAEKQQKIELMARLFAIGVKELGRKLLRLLVENDSEKRQMQFNGKWVTIDPHSWDAEMDLDVEVGLGAGRAAEQMQSLGQIAEFQKALLLGGKGHMVSDQNLYHSATKLAEIAGHKDGGQFFTDPANVEPQDPQPDYEGMKLELEGKKAEAAANKQTLDMELELKKQEELTAYRFSEMQAKMEVERERIAMQERGELGRQEATLEAARISAAAQLEVARIGAEAQRFGATHSPPPGSGGTNEPETEGASDGQG